jgi:hypothetical protein
LNPHAGAVNRKLRVPQPKKKAAPEGAAKFREETPRKGMRGATAPQQYGRAFAAVQEKAGPEGCDIFSN